MTMFERYSDLLQRKYSADFDQVGERPLFSNSHTDIPVG